MGNPIRSETNIETELLPVPILQIWPILEVLDAITARATEPREVDQYLRINTRNWQTNKRWANEIIHGLNDLRRIVAMAINALFDAIGYKYRFTISGHAFTEGEVGQYVELKDVEMEITRPCVIDLWHTYRALDTAAGQMTFVWECDGEEVDSFYVDTPSEANGWTIEVTPPIVGTTIEIKYDPALASADTSTRFQHTHFELEAEGQSKIQQLETVHLVLKGYIGGLTAPLEESENEVAAPEYISGKVLVEIYRPVRDIEFLY